MGPATCPRLHSHAKMTTPLLLGLFLVLGASSPGAARAQDGEVQLAPQEEGAPIEGEATGDPPPEPEPVGDGADDLRRVFRQVPAFESITLALTDGVLVLGGTTPSPTARQDAEDLAREIPGVVWVLNQVELPPEPEVTDEPEAPEEVSPTARDEALAQDLRAIFSQVPAWSQIKVRVEAGVVHLLGTVPSGQAGDEARALVAGRDSVVFVDSLLETETALTKRILPSLERLLESLRALIARIPLFIVGAAVFAAFVWLTRRLTGWERGFSILFPSALSRDLAKQVTRTILLALGAFVVLDLIDATALATATLGTAGLVGLAVSFAFRDIFENYLASLILSMRRPFRSRDFVKVGDSLGKVIRMTTSDTLLLTPDGNHLRIPNAKVFKEVILNYSTNPLRRFDFAVGAGVDQDVELAQELGLGALKAMPGVIDDPAPSVLVEGLGDSHVPIRFYGWVDQREADYGKVRSYAVKNVKHVLDEAGIEMPEPTYRVLLRKPALGPGLQPHHEIDQPEPKDIAPDHELDRQIEAEEPNQQNLLDESLDA